MLAGALLVCAHHRHHGRHALGERRVCGIGTDLIVLDEINARGAQPADEFRGSDLYQPARQARCAEWGGGDAKPGHLSREPSLADCRNARTDGPPIAGLARHRWRPTIGLSRDALTGRGPDPLLGLMLNGTSSVLYGTVPELAPPGGTERAFALFYPGTIASGAIAPMLYGFLGDVVGLHVATLATALTALAIVPLAVALRPVLKPARRRYSREVCRPSAEPGVSPEPPAFSRYHP